MLRNNLKIALRNTIKHKGYSVINLFGLAVGIACFSIIMLYVIDELSYDKFHKDADRIYRVTQNQVDPELANSVVPPALGPALPREIPEIISSVRIYQWGSAAISYGDATFNETGNLTADSTFFDVFSFTFIRGEPKTALRSSSSIVLTESLAKKYFGNDDPMGKTLTLNSGRPEDFQVSAVIADVPLQSHFRFDYVLPVHRMPWVNWANNLWHNVDPNAHTYIKLAPGTSVDEIAEKIQKLVNANNPKNADIYSIQPLAGLDGIHLSSHRTRELQANSDTLYIKALVLIALLVILIAGINYVNLATARSAVRAKEIGVRKVVGAYRTNLIRQFLTESLLTAVLAGLLAVVLAESVLPFFNTVMQKELSLFTQTGQSIWLWNTLVVFCIGLVAGLYPAFYLSSFRPVLVFKKRLRATKAGFGLRRGLVVLQFGLATLLIVGLLVVQNQLNFIRNANLGFNKDQVIIIPNIGGALNQDIGSGFRNRLAMIPGVLEAGAGSELGTISGGWRERMQVPGSDKELFFTGMQIDHNYLDVMKIELKEGRNFSPDFPADSAWLETVILNETAIKNLGLQDPVIGQQILVGSGAKAVRSTIIGVVKDFHFSSFHKGIDSFAFFWWKRANRLAVKLAGGDIQGTIGHIRDIWTQHVSGLPFDYYFLDMAIDRQYRFEQNFRTIFSAMTGLSLVIACLGLFGLTAFTAEQRTKEIGIRKVLGATVGSIVALLSKDFVKLVVGANIIAWPSAYIVMNKWLDNFAYRIDVGLSSFAIAGCLAFMIAALTVGLQAAKAAIANPVQSLRYE